MSVKQFEDLEVWKDARRLTQRIYHITQTDKFSKDFALRDQIRRATVSIMSNIAEGLEFEVIAAVIIGGTSLAGGEGSIIGTFLGVLFIGLLSNGMTLLGVPSFAQEVARGLIILVAVLISVWQKPIRR